MDILPKYLYFSQIAPIRIPKAWFRTLLSAIDLRALPWIVQSSHPLKKEFAFVTGQRLLDLDLLSDKYGVIAKLSPMFGNPEFQPGYRAESRAPKVI